MTMTQSTTLADRSGSSKTWQLILRGIAVGVLILVGIEIMNQFLIFSGAALAKTLQPKTPIAGFWVGVVQQIVQAAVGILLYAIFFKKGIGDLGINLENRGESLRYFRNFALAWLGVIAVYLSVSYFLVPSMWHAMRTAALPPANIRTTTLLFEVFFPGMGEEILFRGLILSVLAKWVFPRYEQHRPGRMAMIALSGLYFATAHIYFTVAPFQITHIDGLQIAMALGCGVIYAVMYLKTKSLLAPFLAHNFSNTTSTIFGYLIASL